MIRLEIVSYNKIVFEGDFPTLSDSQNFYSWWSNKKTLPQGGAIHYRVGTNKGFISPTNNIVKEIVYNDSIEEVLDVWGGKRANG